MAIGFGGLATYAAVSTDPYIEKVNPEGIRISCAIMGCFALGAGFVGIREIYKTCKAPRQGDRQALLPPSNA